MALALAASAAIAAAAATSPSGATVSVGPCAAAASNQQAWVECMLGQMTLEQKVGQLFVVNGFGDSVDSPKPADAAANRAVYGPQISTIEDLINRYQPGGIVYFAWSNELTDPAQVNELSNGIQQVALSQSVPTPMWISIDQEEGEVLRVGTPATVFPGNMALGSTRSLKLAYRAARITGRELRAMGINVDNAPVVDVNSNPLNIADGIRSYGDRKSLVSNLGAAQVNGYEDSNVGAMAKHWPGLGATSTNPDNGITVSNQTLEQLERSGFRPFRVAIDAGVESVMVTHISVPQIDPSGTPTTLNPLFVDGLLRGRLGFDGVVSTDALNAQALADFTPAQVALMAINAGNDQLTEIGGFPQPTSLSNLVPAYEAVLNAVRSGEITLARIETSVRRILAMKWSLGLARGPYAGSERVAEVVGTSAHLEVARRIANRSMTLLRNRGGVLPLRANSGDRVLVAGWGQTGTPLLANEIASRDLTANALVTGANPTAEQIRRAARTARNYDVIVVNTFNAWAPDSEGQARLVRALVRTGKPVIVLAVGTPYDIAYLPKTAAFLAAYDYQPVSLNAAVATLFGRNDPAGRLPVTIRSPNRPGKVLYRFGFGLGYGR